MKKTIAQEAGHDFTTNDIYAIFDVEGNLIYTEDIGGYWVKREFDDDDNLIYFEDSDGFWVKYEYDKNNNKIGYRSSLSSF